MKSTLKTLHPISYRALAGHPQSHSTCMLPWWRPSGAESADCSLRSLGPPGVLLLSGTTRPAEEAGPGLEAEPAAWGSEESYGGVTHLQEPGTASDIWRRPPQCPCRRKWAPLCHHGHPHRCIQGQEQTDRRPGCEQASDWLRMQQTDSGPSAVVGVALWGLEGWRHILHLIKTIRNMLCKMCIQ